jgi:hypothetical protein
LILNNKEKINKISFFISVFYLKYNIIVFAMQQLS